MITFLVGDSYKPSFKPLIPGFFWSETKLRRAGFDDLFQVAGGQGRAAYAVAQSSDAAGSSRAEAQHES